MEAAVNCITTKLRAKYRVPWESQVVKKKQDNFKNHPYSKKGTQQILMYRKITDDLVFLPNTESLLHSLEQAAGDIGLYVNANKTEFMYLK